MGVGCGGWKQLNSGEKGIFGRGQGSGGKGTGYRIRLAQLAGGPGLSKIETREAILFQPGSHSSRLLAATTWFSLWLPVTQHLSFPTPSSGCLNTPS